MAMNAYLVRMCSCDMAGFVIVWIMTKGGTTACPARTPAYIEAVRMKEDRRITIRMLGERLNTDRETIRTILTDIRKINWARLLFLIHRQPSSEKRRIAGSQDFLEMQANDTEFINEIVTGDKSQSMCIQIP